ncbi:MAG: pyridoxamine kinase [Clostridia bacterium]|nr:pyridoxamine kinase [Clostridia bacterium]
MKRIMTIQDISCVGKCSLTVALPIISAAGVEAAVLPTAVLSTHTAFSKFTFRDLTDEITPIGDTLKELNIDFDAIYTGYLGSFEQLALVEKFINDFKGSDTFVLIDPVMADNGKLYKGFTEEFAKAMAGLCARADLIVPNITEAAYMLGIPYNPDYTEDDIRELLKRLTTLGCPRAALTGISFDEGEIGVYYYDSTTDTYFKYFNDRLPVSYHGTGDTYASAALGAIMRGISIEKSLEIAVDFTLESMKETESDPEHRFYGVNFESALPFYIDKIKANI